MATETKTVSRKPRRWLRVLVGFFICMIVGLVMLYFIGTSEWGLKRVILPKVSKAANAEVTVDGASISPFSSVNLRGLKVVTKGPEPLVTAKEVRLRYSLMDIIKGNINVSEVTMDSPTVTLITFADGTSNLDPITKGDKEKKPKEKKEPKAKKDDKPAQLNLHKLALNNATVRKITQRKDGSQEVLLLSGVNVTAADIANNKTGKLTLAADVNLNQGLNTASNGVLVAKVAGDFALTLDAALKPTMAKGQTKVEVTQGQGAFAQVNGLGVVLNTDVTPTQLNDVSVRFSQAGKNLGAITASGPFSAETMEGKIVVVVAGIDKQVLNLAGAAAGVDFNQTTIGSTNTIELTQKGRVISVNGALLVGSFGVTQKGQTTPTMDVRSGYAVTLDQSNKTALVKSFTLNGTQGSNEFLRGTLAKPMLLDLGKGSNAVDESAFDLVVTNFNLVDWKAFLGTNLDLASGNVSLNLNLLSKQAGKQLAFKTDLHVANVVMNDPSLPKTPLGVDVSADAAIVNGKVFDLNAVKIALTKTERADNVLNIAGHIDMTKSNAWAGNVKITSDGLDLTTYYDTFAKKKTNVTETAKAEKRAPEEPKESKPAEEPAAIKLPFAQFTEELNIAKVFLREVTISNLVSKTTINNGRVSLNPFSLTLNGAPVNATADLNLAVQGFEYDVNAKMDRVPVEPLVNTFQPERKGQVKGDLLVNAQVKGAGVTGGGFKKNLQGLVLLNLTNANVQVSKFEKVQRLLKPLATTLATPELADSPLTWIDTQVGIGNGTVTITNAKVRSYFFNAGIDGTMTINEVLTNSTFNNMPVQLAVAGSVAKRLQFLAKDNSEVIALPHFYSIGGTLGKPDPHIDSKGLFKGAAAETISRIGGDKLKGVTGGLLGGGTNSSAGSTNSGGSVLKGLENLLDKQPKTNTTRRRNR